MIHIIDGQSDEIVGIIPNDEFWDDNYHRSLETTAETFEFTTFADKEYSEYLTGRNKVIIPDEDSGYRELTIWQAEKVHEHSKLMIVFTKASYNDLRKAQVIKPQSLKSKRASEIAGIVLDDTEWRVGIVESDGARTFHIEKHTDPYSMLKRIATEFDLELNFRVETKGNKITGRYVDLVQQIGQWRGREIEFGKDLLSIKRIEDTDNIYTALIGLGPEKDGTRLEVLVEDLDALQRWGRRDPVTGELRHIIGTYEPQTEKDELSYDRLRTLTKNELEKRINEVIEYEAEIADLEHVPGMENEKIRFGDTLKIKDTLFNPPLYVEARVFEVSGSIKERGRKSIKLGDFIEYKEEEVKAIWQSLQEEIKKRISYNEMVEYTYNKLTIDDKDKTVFEDGKTFAEATGIKAEENAKDFAVEQDSKIKLDVEQYADNVAEQEAQSALDQAKMYAVAKTVYDNKMQQIASDITDRAPLEYVDGKIAIVDGRLDDFNIKVEEKADKTTVYTIEQIDNRINNLVTKTQYTTDMNGVVHQLDSHGTRIGQNEEAIGLKADDTKVDNINNSLTQKIANVEVKADSVTTKVEKVEAEVEGLEVGGRNLLKDSNNFKIYNTYQDSKAEVIENVSVPEWGATDASRIKASGGDSYVKLVVDSNYLNVEQPPKEGEKFVVSVWVKNLGDNPLVVSPNARGKRVTVFKGENKRVVIQAEGTGRAWLQIQFTTPQDAADKPLDFIAWRAQIEKGNKATDWTPAPEDTEADISNLQGRVNTAEGEIKTLAGEVTAKASQSTVDALNRRVSTAESELKLLPGEINAKVSKDGVIGAINATPEQLLIDFKKVKMTGELEAKHIKSLNGLNVNNQFIVDASGNVKYGGHLDGATGTFRGSIDTPMLTVGADSIKGYENFGLRLQTAQWQSSLTEPFKKTGYIVFNTLENALELYQTDLNGKEIDMAGFRVNAKRMDFLGDVQAHGFFYSNAIDHFGGGVHLYVRPKPGGELRATVTGSTNDWVDIRGRFVYANAVDINTGTHLYMRPARDGVVKVTREGTTGSYRPIQASSFDNKSLAKYKSNIDLFNKSALDIIRKTDICKFQLKSDLDAGEAKDRYGLVIGTDYRTPDEFLNYDKTAVDLYAEASIALKAIQELDGMQQDVKDRLAWLETENSFLKQEIKNLKEKIV